MDSTDANYDSIATYPVADKCASRRRLGEEAPKGRGSKRKGGSGGDKGRGKEAPWAQPPQMRPDGAQLIGREACAAEHRAALGAQRRVAAGDDDERAGARVHLMSVSLEDFVARADGYAQSLDARR